MSRQIAVREGARRQHRVVALYAAIQCWVRKLDAIVIERSDLERLIGLERFKSKRWTWLQKDMQPYFEHIEIIEIQGRKKSLGSLYASRVPLELPTGSLSTEQRIAQMQANGFKIEPLVLWNDDFDEDIDIPDFVQPFHAAFGSHDERLLSAYLMLLSQGHLAPKNLPGLPYSKK